MTGLIDRRQVGILGDRTLTPQVIALFGKLRQQAWSAKAALRVAAAGAGALAALGGDSVVAPLFAAARDSSFPAIQAAAITALGKRCVRKARVLFHELSASSEHIVAIAAKGARNRCRKVAK